MTEVQVTDQNFKDEVLGYKGLAVVDFWAEWCGPCKIMEPVISEIAAELGDSVKICKLNVDENQETASTYQILSIPTMKFYKNGEVIDEVIGVQSKDQLLERINKHK